MARSRRRPAALNKVHPKLRMLANGSTAVNVVRAEHFAALIVPPELATSVEFKRGDDAKPQTVRKPPRRRKLKEPPDAYVSVFVQFAPDELDRIEPPKDLQTLTFKGDTATAVLKVEQAVEQARSDRIAGIELGQPLRLPDPIVSTAQARTSAPSTEERRFGNPRQHRNGEDVLIGLIDVGGFDFAHPDFLVGGKTRFVAIWDQGGETRATPAANGRIPSDYGAELLKEDLNGAIQASAETGLPVHVLEPQSQASVGSHGTHVASIAAGNRGICRRAKIAAVSIAIPEDELERRRSFYDSTRLAHAVDYLLAVAEAEGGKAISINISLGTNGHAHDDSSPIARWIDASLTRPGRCVCVAAGNAGQEKPETPGDIGYILGRVHSSGTIPARELTAEIEWNVVGNGRADLSENELEIWYSPADRFSVQVRPPDGPWTERVQPGEFIENRQLADGARLSVYNQLYHPANGANLIAVYLSPSLDELVPVTAGEWLVRLNGEEVRDGRYNCWIERDDPRRVGRLGSLESWWFPSHFSERSFVDRSTISSLACGARIVSVANLDDRRRAINKSSSQGPTRDGREKPDIAAPGTNIVAARGFAGSDRWVSMTGTSMASPYVAGVAGLMLSLNKDLTSAQIAGILRRTARPLAGSDFRWRDDAGVGAIDPERCLEEAAAMRSQREIT
jgi:subtilisin family serine protease